jgi:hypothetical protein
MEFLKEVHFRYEIGLASGLTLRFMIREASRALAYKVWNCLEAYWFQF